MWLQTTGWDYFKSPVSLSYFLANGNLMYPFVEFNTTAIFDPQVDYMYVNQLEFDMFMAPILHKIYNDTSFNCTDNECHWNTTCDKVHRMGASLQFSISNNEQHYFQVQIQLEDYLIDGRSQFGKDHDSCYLPIFIVDPAQAIDTFGTWFLGNMVLDRYMIIHDMEGASDIGGKYRPRIGIYDKKENSLSSDSNLFLQ